MFEQDLVNQIIGMIKQEMDSNEKKEIPVGISNRHIHLSQEDLEILFGKGYELTELKPLKQPGQYAAKETVCVAGPKGSFEKVRILGPVRKESQLEISKTDSFTLGVKAPIRDSGNLVESGDICVIGPKGSVVLKSKVIAAKRHIHMSPADAAYYNVADKQIVNVIVSGERKTILGEVLVRVNPNFDLEMHVDTDEANATGLTNKSTVQISDISF